MIPDRLVGIAQGSRGRHDLLRDCAARLGWTITRIVNGPRYPHCWVLTDSGRERCWSPFGNTRDSDDLAAAVGLGAAKISRTWVSIAVHDPERHVVQMPVGADPEVTVRRMRVLLASMLYRAGF